MGSFKASYINTKSKYPLSTDAQGWKTTTAFILCFISIAAIYFVNHYYIISMYAYLLFLSANFISPHVTYERLVLQKVVPSDEFLRICAYSVVFSPPSLLPFSSVCEHSVLPSDPTSLIYNTGTFVLPQNISIDTLSIATMTYFPNYNIHNPPMLSSLSSASTQNSPLDEPNLQNTKQESSDEMKPIEDFLAAEFSQLSAEEKTKALSDMYCVEDLNENPGMAQQSLVDFEIRLQNGMFPIYEAAWNQNRAYVEDPLFRLKFLRANMYDVSKSVNQLVNFLGHKATYFGLDKLARDITLHDLNQEDMDLMLSGFYHIQDGEDQSGRVVVYMLNHLLGKCKAETLVRPALLSS